MVKGHPPSNVIPVQQPQGPQTVGPNRCDRILERDASRAGARGEMCETLQGPRAGATSEAFDYGMEPGAICKKRSR